MLTREQKETLVIELYKQGKTIREIAKEVHMSFSRISKIINGFEGIHSEKKGSISRETKALKLFKGKDLVYVATRLDIKPEDVKKLYLEFQSLQGVPSLKDMHNELGNTLPKKNDGNISYIKCVEKVDFVPKVSL